MAISSINNNDKLTVYCGSTKNSNNTENSKGTDTDNQKNGEDNSQKKIGDSVFAGDLNLYQNDILMKKVQAQKSAIKTILEAFNGEGEIDQNLEERNQHIDDMMAETEQAHNELNNIDAQKQKLRETFDVTDGSDEQKNLELLEKQQRIKRGGTTETLSVEETIQLENMGPQTEYQKAALEYDDMAGQWYDQIDKAKEVIINENMTISAINLGREKSHVMVDANKEADSILENASKEVMGILVDQIKDKVDEQTDDTKDQIKENEEQKIEEEKQKEKADSKDTATANSDSTNLNQVQEADSTIKKLQSEIKNMIDNQKLLDEDVKGVEVDEGL